MSSCNRKCGDGSLRIETAFIPIPENVGFGKPNTHVSKFGIRLVRELAKVPTRTVGRAWMEFIQTTLLKCIPPIGSIHLTHVGPDPVVILPLLSSNGRD
jgi:hypothetical protein